jgi:cell division protein FtsB
VKPDPSKTRFRPVLGTTAVAVLLLLAVAGVKSYSDLASARQRQDLLEESIHSTHERIRELRQRIELLRTDPLTLERLAREELGMVKPGEVVIVLPPPEAEAEAGSAPPG